MVAVVTNSICDLSPEMAEEYGVLMIPDVIIFSEAEQFRNNLEIDPPTLFARLPKCEQLPTTAAKQRRIRRIDDRITCHLRNIIPDYL